MKVSTSILKAVALGVTVSAMASCAKTELLPLADEREITTEEVGICGFGDHVTPIDPLDCPACGMG